MPTLALHSSLVSTDKRHRLRLLSYNIQAGVTTSRYHHYLTRSWKHVLPDVHRHKTMASIAGVISDFDIVGLQEADIGSLRTGFVNQAELLAELCHFPHWHQQATRRFANIAQQSNALLSRIQPNEVRSYRLPGLVPGRGAILAHFGNPKNPLIVLIIHLALGRRSRIQQLSLISNLVHKHPYVVVMGDLNCQPHSPELSALLRKTGLKAPATKIATYPSWRPKRHIDHILVSPSLEVTQVCALEHTVSDHLPLATEILVPAEIGLWGENAPGLPAKSNPEVSQKVA
ncbi:endonuclease/exonuclease/phosphatase family protein [Nitrosococcus wardiae]|uniref:EEP domain-containing protein n=1 Tax=Nitrosococcus wardiae TaxID=1814290 RepID=A0A4P7BTU2_9GAMM|nr:endonuclease/exonuclease/phosphatase family protein [Nitrosococcus wardiae]QBQ53308.1 EEP domain-containing protein [Nitrosococcus wardiae]